jgi:Fe2+ or Zn2+ uptake regulation protein
MNSKKLHLFTPSDVLEAIKEQMERNLSNRCRTVEIRALLNSKIKEGEKEITIQRLWRKLSFLEEQGYIRKRKGQGHQDIYLVENKQ